MKKIEAVIAPFKLDDVREALIALGIQGMTVFEAKGFGRQRGHNEIYRGVEYAYEFIPKHYILLIVEDHQVEQVVAAIINAANTGKIGAGKIIVSSVESFIHIRTGKPQQAIL